MKVVRDDIRSEESKKLFNQWKKYPVYIIVGHNPYLEIIKVFNLTVSEDVAGREILEWDLPLVDGSRKKEKYECGDNNL